MFFFETFSFFDLKYRINPWGYVEYSKFCIHFYYNKLRILYFMKLIILSHIELYFIGNKSCPVFLNTSQDPFLKF